jgi:hypothetical protein
VYLDVFGLGDPDVRWLCFEKIHHLIVLDLITIQDVYDGAA